jgi:DNA-binding transcriptional ArsR family regulator
MSTERERILKMLAEGKISVAEAEELLDALSKNKPAEDTTATPSGKKPKYLRVQVDPGNKSGKEQVNIRIPLQLIRAGAKLASVVPSEAREKVNRALHEKGIGLDINDLNSEKLESVIESLGDLSVDVDGEDEKVKIFCE